MAPDIAPKGRLKTQIGKVKPLKPLSSLSGVEPMEVGDKNNLSMMSQVQTNVAPVLVTRSQNNSHMMPGS